MNNDFYVGYQPQAPPDLARFIRKVAACLVVGLCSAGAFLLYDQQTFARSRFAYGVLEEYRGVLETWPYPMLIAPNASYLLVGRGKHAFSEIPDDLPGKYVRLQASAAGRGSDRLLEVAPGSLVPDRSARIEEAPVIALGSFQLRGEIVDSKCYLGVMNPGERKVHRDCAARCISGGLPPAFVARDSNGQTRLMLLTDQYGHPFGSEILSFVGEALELRGDLVRSGTTYTLKASLPSFRRLTE